MGFFGNRGPTLEEKLLSRWLGREESEDAYALVLSELHNALSQVSYCYYRCDGADYVLRHTQRDEDFVQDVLEQQEDQLVDPRYRISDNRAPGVEEDYDPANVVDNFVLEPMGRFKVHAAFRRPRLIGNRARMFASVPLSNGKKRIGLVLWGPYFEKKVAERDLRQVERMQSTLALCFDAADRHEEQRRKIQDLERSVESARLTMAAALDFGHLIESLLIQAVRASGFHSGFYAELQPDESLKIQLDYRLPEKLAADKELNLRKDLVRIEQVGDHSIITAIDSGLKKYEVAQSLMLPIFDGHTLRAVIGLLSQGKASNSDLHALNLLEGFSKQIGLVYARERQTAEFGAAYYITLMALCDGLDMASMQPGHHDRVAELATALAKELGLTEEDVTLAERAARIHDVGFVPAARLDCTAIEAEFQHPVLGASLVAPLPDGTEIAELIIQHHETNDAYGFPSNLRGSSMSMKSQVLGAAEFLAECIEGNQVTRPMDMKALVARVKQESGRRFSNPIAEAAEAMLKNNPQFFEKRAAA